MLLIRINDLYIISPVYEDIINGFVYPFGN